MCIDDFERSFMETFIRTKLIQKITHIFRLVGCIKDENMNSLWNGKKLVSEIIDSTNTLPDDTLSMLTKVLDYIIEKFQKGIIFQWLCNASFPQGRYLGVDF